MKAALVLAALMLAPALGRAQPVREDGLLIQPGEKRPLYVQRIQMPLRGDAFRQPRAVVADLHADEVFVCDLFNNRVVIFDGQGLYSYEIPGGNTFRAPRDLAVGPQGHLYVLGIHAGAQRIIHLDFDGRLLGVLDFSGFPEGIRPPSFRSLTMTPSGDRFFLIDADNHRLWIADEQARIIESVDYEQGLTQEEIEDLVIGRVDVYDSTVLVAIPTWGQVMMYDLEGNSLGFVGRRGTTQCHLAFPHAAAMDTEGNVIVLDKQRALFMAWNPEENQCLGEYYGFGTLPGWFYQPDDIALDLQGRLYVSQGFEGRVQVYEGSEPAAHPPDIVTKVN